MSDVESATFNIIDGTSVSDEQLEASAQLFSDHYGVWDPSFKPNARVRMTLRKLRQECLSDPDRTVLVTCSIGDNLIGQAFAATWKVGEDIVGWITQLVVHRDYRRRRIATCLLQRVRSHRLFSSVTIIGVTSTHPATCNAVASLAGTPIGEVDLEFIREHGPSILSVSPVRYVQSAKQRGALFQDCPDEGVISTLDTDFPVDHGEPEAALETYINSGRWRLGKLPQRHEYLLILPMNPH
ncbi:unnamed protein product [Somion occarium]|uniref:N-acetyltransferase domain-containing protein n=1 Tax=Somion occarium TaxID=3059160 RepID=A0ABP1CT88_9APHY